MLEQTYVRTPFARTINALPKWRWIPSRNVFSPSGVSSVLPGTPDGYAQKWGGAGLIYFECKAADHNGLTNIDLSEWDRQRNWWVKNCQEFGNVPYWIVLGVYSERLEITGKMEWPCWNWFAVTPEMWIDAQGKLAVHGRTSLSLNALTERTIALRTFTIESLWGDYRLYYQAGKLLIPDSHPLSEQLA